MNDWIWIKRWEKWYFQYWELFYKIDKYDCYLDLILILSLMISIHSNDDYQYEFEEYYILWLYELKYLWFEKCYLSNENEKKYLIEV